MGRPIKEAIIADVLSDLTADALFAVVNDPYGEPDFGGARIAEILEATLGESIDDRVAELIDSVTGITVTYDDAGNVLDLSVNIGTEVQAWDQGLQSISELTTAADQVIYTTDEDTYAVTSLTAFARSILDDEDAAAVRTTIGVDPAGTDNSTNVTLQGLDYLTLAGQVITLGQVNLSTDVTGSLPEASITPDYSVFQATSAVLDTYAGIAPSANVQTLLGAASYAAFRTSLSLVVGTNVQAYDEVLAGIVAGTYPGAASIITVGSIGSGTWQATPVANEFVAGLDQDCLTTSSPEFAGATIASLSVSTERLLREDYEITSATYSDDGLMDSAVVKWFDGSAGALTVSSTSTTHEKVTGYAVTHANSGQTVTQPEITLDQNGNPTNIPQVTIT